MCIGNYCGLHRNYWCSNFQYQRQKQHGQKTIEAAIVKGVDPLSVKCAYETSTNPTCITYAMKK